MHSSRVAVHLGKTARSSSTFNRVVRIIRPGTKRLSLFGTRKNGGMRGRLQVIRIRFLRALGRWFRGLEGCICVCVGCGVSFCRGCVREISDYLKTFSHFV